MVNSFDHSWFIPIPPFLKWAGGKRWLVQKHKDLLPKTIEGRYIEPFVGSGAVFFYLRPRNAILADINKDLIDTYKAIKSQRLKLCEALQQHSEKHSKEYYYRIRSERSYLTLSERAARFIYLNRTCFNGIYRVNREGVFNVPIGSKSKVLLPTDCFDIWSKVLKGVELLNLDFESVIEKANKGDFLFVDPPYTVRHNLNGFIQYNEVLFSWEDQLRLAASLNRARKRGVSILLTNANHQSIKDLYSDDFNQRTVSRFSSISASVEKRSAFEELVVSTF